MGLHGCLICFGEIVWVWTRNQIRNKLKVKLVAWICPLKSPWKQQITQACQGHIFPHLSFTFALYISILNWKKVFKSYFSREGLQVVSFSVVPSLTYIFVIYLTENNKVLLVSSLSHLFSGARISENIGPSVSISYLLFVSVSLCSIGYLTFSPLSRFESDCAPQLNWQQTCNHSKQLEVNGNELMSSVKHIPWVLRQEAISILTVYWAIRAGNILRHFPGHQDCLQSCSVYSFAALKRPRSFQQTVRLRSF